MKINNRVAFTLIIYIIIFLSPITGLLATAEERKNEINKSIKLSIECHSGTPPVFEFVLSDPGKHVRRVNFDFDMDNSYDLEINVTKNGNDDRVIFRGTPYRIPGKYNFKAYIITDGGTFIRSYEIGFTRFVWGEDNFSFANDGEFEDKIDFVSKTIIDWGEKRFGNLSQNQKVLLLYVMYNLYKGSIGRCYGFSGGELLFLENPDLIPWPYNSTYEIPEEDPRIIRQMDFKQNDIVFNNFVTGKISLNKRQSSEDLKRQLDIIRSEIIKGRPVVLGYISRKMHHSMVVYGYWKNFFRNKITLLAANNWERNQCNNLFSEDAENIVVTFGEGYHRIVWHDLTRNRYRYPDIIFAIEPQNSYKMDKSRFVNLLNEYKNRIIKEKLNVIMVEKTETAYLTDGSEKRGYSKPNYFYRLTDVSFKKIDYNYIFEYPINKDYILVLKRRRFNKFKKCYKTVNIYTLSPAAGGGIKAGIYRNINISDDNDCSFKLVLGVLKRVK